MTRNIVFTESLVRETLKPQTVRISGQSNAPLARLIRSFQSRLSAHMRKEDWAIGSQPFPTKKIKMQKI